MKRFILSAFLVLLTFSFAIAQDGINYQGAATDANGDELANQNISIRASVLSASASGNLEWEETHSTTTDQFGLFNVVIGQGTNTTNGATATFDDMDWGAANHYLKIEMDATGGTNYAMIGTTQMMAVPYALYAKSAGIDSAMIVNMIDSSITVNSDHFYNSFSYSASLSASTSTSTLLDSLTISKAGLVFIDGVLNVQVERYTCSANVSFYLLDEYGQSITLNSITGLNLTASNCNLEVDKTEFKSASFVSTSNQKIYIYGSYNVSGYNNYQNQGGNSCFFSLSIYK